MLPINVIFDHKTLKNLFKGGNKKDGLLSLLHLSVIKELNFLSKTNHPGEKAGVVQWTCNPRHVEGEGRKPRPPGGPGGQNSRNKS